MPCGDGTGPLGQGPMTGRAAGYCAGFSVPGYMNPIPGADWGGFGYGRGWGRGWGRGFGHGWGRWAYPYGAPYVGNFYGAPYGSPYNPQMTPRQEADMLKEQAKAIQEEIDAINQRLKDIESAQTSEGNEQG